MALAPVPARSTRIGPLHPRLGRAAFRFLLPILERYYARHRTYRLNSAFAAERLRAVRAEIDRGVTVYLAGIASGGMHNSGVALVEASRQGGIRLICNHEEERFSGKKHSTEYPRNALDALLKTTDSLGIRPDRIAAWLGTWDYPAFGSTLLRILVEELPRSIALLRLGQIPSFNLGHSIEAVRAANTLGQQLGVGGPMPIIGMPHHENHAWFSFSVSPFARTQTPVMIAVLDGMGDFGAISLYVAELGMMRKLRCNCSTFDSLGFFYGVISATQGGWTWLSSEGRYMGAAAFGNGDRLTNPFYVSLAGIFSLEADGQVYLNRALANWHRNIARKPYTPELIRIIGEPLAQEQMWNPDAVLRVEEKDHAPATKERLDKAAATQMVFEDALFHIIDYLIRETGSDKLVLTGGTALNAVANMRLLDHFDTAYYRRTFGNNTRLHLWVPPVPGDAGVTIGAAYMFAHLAGAKIGPPLEHAFFCGFGPTEMEIRLVLECAPDIGWLQLGDLVAKPEGRYRLADFMAFMTAQDGVFAIFQGPAETGPRALGHRSIVANPCNPRIRDVLNRKVKYREAIRPLAPMMTLEAAQQFFELSDGATDDNYNAYNYMVLTAHSKPEARARIPAVIHADGTGRLQIVREGTDPMTYAYLKALGRRIGVEAAVNTSFNVAGPIAQSATQAIDTLRRSKGMDAVLLFAEEGPVFAAWHAGATEAMASGGRFRTLLAQWQAETGAACDLPP
jgi:carbamoyltransferase